jgi:hypothetical protein
MTDMYENYLAHHGVPGMKWGVHRNRITLGDRVRMHQLKKQAAATNRRTGPEWRYNLESHKLLTKKGYDTYTNKNNRSHNEKLIRNIEAKTHSKDRIVRKHAKSQMSEAKLHKKAYQVYDKTLDKYQKTLQKYKTKDADLTNAAKLLASVKAQSKSTIVGDVTIRDYNRLANTRGKYRLMETKRSMPKGW